MTRNLCEPPGTDRAQTPRCGGPDAATAVFLTARPRLLAIGRSVLGDPGEAEDVVQEAWLRWHRTDHATVLSPAAFLAMTTTRLAINITQSARRRHESAATPWLPDTHDPAPGPETTAEHHQQIATALHLLLQRLTPAQRAAYLLRHAFDYPYRHIADLLGLTPDHTRQLVRRAHQHLATGRPRPVRTTTHRHLLHTFLAAARTGDLTPLETLLTTGLTTDLTTSQPHRTCHRRPPAAPARTDAA